MIYLFNEKKNCAANSIIESIHESITLYWNLISYGHQGEMSGIESYLMPINRLQPSLAHASQSMLSVLLLLKPRQSSGTTKWRYFLHFLVWISKHFSRLVISSRSIWFVVWFLAFRFSQNWKEIIRISGKQIDHKPFNPLCQTIARRHAHGS